MSNARNAARIEFHGTEATLFIDRGGYLVIPERKSKVPASELILGEGPRGADFYNLPDGELLHLTNWLERTAARKTPTAPAEAGRAIRRGRAPGESIAADASRGAVGWGEAVSERCHSGGARKSLDGQLFEEFVNLVTARLTAHTRP